MNDITELQARFPWGTKVIVATSGATRRVVGWSEGGTVVLDTGAWWHPDRLTVIGDLPTLPAESWGLRYVDGGIGTFPDENRQFTERQAGTDARHLIVIKGVDPDTLPAGVPVAVVCDGETGEPLPIGGAE